MERRRKILLWFIGILTGILFAVGSILFTFLPDGKLHLFFLDVGQGDGIAFQTPDGTTFLVDGGPSKKILSEFGEYLPFWQRGFDFVILTHPDADHAAGLTEVSKRYRIKNFLTSGAFKTNPVFKKLLSNLEEQKTRIHFIDRDDDFTLSDGTQMNFLWPEESRLIFDEPQANNRAIVFLLTSKNKRILFTADIDDVIEQKLLPELSNINLLKVAHHGSRYGTSKTFLAATKPEIAVISAGKKNHYGHPHPDTLKRLREAGVSVYRTDVLGTVPFSF